MRYLVLLGVLGCETARTPSPDVTYQMPDAGLGSLLWLVIALLAVRLLTKWWNP